MVTVCPLEKPCVPLVAIVTVVPDSDAEAMLWAFPIELCGLESEPCWALLKVIGTPARTSRLLGAMAAFVLSVRKPAVRMEVLRTRMGVVPGVNVSLINGVKQTWNAPAEQFDAAGLTTLPGVLVPHQLF